MKLKDSDWQGNFGYWQKSFIHANLMMIGYSAWQGFLQYGRGVVVCDIDRAAIAPSLEFRLKKEKRQSKRDTNCLK